MNDKGEYVGDSIILEFSKEHTEVHINDKYDLVIELTDPESEIYQFIQSLRHS